MAHKSVIVVQKPNEKIAAAFINILCKDFPSYMGVAAIENGSLVSTSVKGAPKAEQFAEISEALGTSHIVFTVGKAGHDLLEEDQQPHVILRNDTGQPIVSAFLAGGFDGYAVVKSSHTPEYHCVQEILIPKMKKLYKGSGNDLAALIEELKDDVTQNDFKNCWVNNGNIVFMTANGPVVISSAANIKQGTFNWGWTNDAFNYKEQTVAKDEKPAVVEEKPLTLRQKLLLKAGATKTTGETVVVDKTVTGPAKPTETSAAAINAVMEEYEDVRLPAAASDWVNKKKIEWWVGEIGYKPEGYKDLKTTAKRRKGTKMGVLHPLFSEKAKEEAIAAGVATPLPSENNAPAASVEAPMGIVEEVHVKDTSVKNVSTAFMPILSPKQKLGLKTSWMKDAEVVKTLGDDFKAVIDPKLLKEYEETYASFWDSFGLSETPRPLSYEAYVKLGEVDIRALAKLAWENQNDSLRHQLKIKTIIADPKMRVAM